MSPNLPSTAEQLSALADGRLTDSELARVLAVCAEDERMQAHWRDYHLIGDALRGQALTAPADAAAFLARLRPALQAPARPAQPASQAANEPALRWTWRAAAAVAALAVVLAWTLPGLLSEGADLAAGQAPVLVATPQGAVVRDAALDELLEDHRQQAGASVLPMPSGFLRNAIFEAESTTLTGRGAGR
jgi:sigma-E factor negative regulatory protein RseA